MCDILRNEFRLKNFWFQHHKPEAFYTSQVKWGVLATSTGFRRVTVLPNICNEIGLIILGCSKGFLWSLTKDNLF